MGDREVIMVILIPELQVPANHIPKKLSNKTPGCELMLDMFIDVDNSNFYDCAHNTAQLTKIISHMFPSWTHFDQIGVKTTIPKLLSAW